MVGWMDRPIDGWMDELVNGWMVGQTDMTNPAVAMRNCAKAPKNGTVFTQLDIVQQIAKERFLSNNSFTP
jgi:hypothetical protein